ncbi:MAG: histidine phosphatase family protein, partial [Actinomycetes bacterium]
AQILATDLGVALDEPCPQLREWQAPDCVLGLAPAGYPPQYLRWRRVRAAEPDTALLGGESLTAFAQRALKAAKLIEDIATRSRQPILVVTHVLLIGAIAAHTAGIHEPAGVFAAAARFTLPPARWWQHPTTANTWDDEISRRERTPASAPSSAEDQRAAPPDSPR